MDWRPDIQGLRGIAILLVVAFHSGLPLPGGFTGVDVFFVISGFVIAGLILRHAQSAEGFSFLSFYIRRARRLTPALAVMLIVVAFAAIALQSPFGSQQVTGQTAVGAALVVANFVIYTNTGGYFDGPAEANPLLNTWSLSVEEQFYFIFPALLIAAWVLGGKSLAKKSRQMAIALLSVLAVASFCAALAFTSGWAPGPVTKPEVFSFYAPFTRAWEFAIGALLAVVLFGRRVRVGRSATTLLAAAGAVGIGASAIVISSADPFPGFITLLPVLASAAVIAGGRDTIVARGLATRPLVWLGAISYSWYLWHWPAIVFARELWPNVPHVALLAALASLIPAWLSLRFIENPIRFSQGLKPRRVAVLLGAAIAAPILAGFVLLRGADSLWWNEQLQEMAAQVIPLPPSYYAGCASFTPLNERELSACTWNADQPGQPVYLIGDSQAGALTEGMIGATELVRRPLVVADAGSCPFALVEPNAEPLVESGCATFVAGSVDYLTQQPPTAVIIGTSPSYFDSDRADELLAAMNRSVTALRSAGHEVTLVGPVPQFPGWWPWGCTLVEAVSDTTGCGEFRPLDAIETELLTASASLRKVARDGDAMYLEIFKDVCLTDRCATNDGTRWIYRDGLHISNGESARLTLRLATAIRVGNV